SAGSSPNREDCSKPRADSAARLRPPTRFPDLPRLKFRAKLIGPTDGDWPAAPEIARQDRKRAKVLRDKNEIPKSCQVMRPRTGDRSTGREKAPLRWQREETRSRLFRPR